MTRAQVIKCCVKVRKMPFCQLECQDEADGTWWTTTLTRREYAQQMGQENRPWQGPDGAEAWYDDEVSEALQDEWHVAARKARKAVAEWEAAHKGTIPQWATKF